MSNRSNPAAVGVSNNQGSVKLRMPCCATAPTRKRTVTSQPRPRKFRCERSTVPTMLSVDENPPPMLKTPVGFSTTSMLTMIFVLSAPGAVEVLTDWK